MTIGDSLPKRIFDLTIAITALPFAVVICCIVAVPIWFECQGSPFFWQERVGKDEQQFKLLKLRTMAIGTQQAGSHDIGQSAILKTGAVLRKLKIDELPQLWNVLLGDMSLVGPRPGLSVQHDLTEARRSERVYALKPGITGLAQIDGIDMSTPKVLAKRDADYLAAWSLRQDIRILIQTVLGKGRGDAAKSASK
jgi:O-antigen biosynthesis protein WbqP